MPVRGERVNPPEPQTTAKPMSSFKRLQLKGNQMRQNKKGATLTLLVCSCNEAFELFQIANVRGDLLKVQAHKVV
jgi:hypothetical protein